MLNRWVLSRDRKTATEGAEVTRSGRLFQTRAAVTGKARSPTVDNRVRLTINDDDELERSRWRASTSATWQSSSVRYADADPWRHLYTRIAYLKFWMQSALGPSAMWSWCRSGVMCWNFDEEKNEPSGGVHHWLQPWQEMWWNAGQCRIAVVQPWEDERRHQRLKNSRRTVSKLN